MNKIEINFTSKNISDRTPYVRNIIEFFIDIQNNYGYLEYDGYFYVDDEDLPINLNMFISQTEETPYKIENNISFYNKIIDKYYLIEVYKKEKYESTNKYSESIYLFPTNREKIYFKIEGNIY